MNDHDIYELIISIYYLRELAKGHCQKGGLMFDNESLKELEFKEIDNIKPIYDSGNAMRKFKN